MREKDLVIFFKDKQEFIIPLAKIFKLDVLGSDLGVTAFLYNSAYTSDEFVLLKPDF